MKENKWCQQWTCYGTLPVPERHHGINVTNNAKANISKIYEKIFSINAWAGRRKQHILVSSVCALVVRKLRREVKMCGPPDHRRLYMEESVINTVVNLSTPRPMQCCAELQVWGGLQGCVAKMRMFKPNMGCLNSLSTISPVTFKRATQVQEYYSLFICNICSSFGLLAINASTTE